MDMHTAIIFQLQFRTLRHKDLKTNDGIGTEWGTSGMAMTKPK